MSKKWLPGPWEKYSWVVELARARRRLTLPRGRERIYTSKFSKVNALRKGLSGADGQEETCFVDLRGMLRHLGHNHQLAIQKITFMSWNSLIVKPGLVGWRIIQWCEAVEVSAYGSRVNHLGQKMLSKE